MKKLFSLLCLCISTNYIFGQTFQTALGPKGVLDTLYYLNLPGGYLLHPNKYTLLFDSSKVGVSLAKVPTRDSIQLISGSGTVLATVKDSVGSGGGTTYTAGNGLVLQSTQFKVQDTLNGSGKKFQWFFAKAAFRADSSSSTQTDIGNIGLGSAGFGINCTALGPESFAGGLTSRATNNYGFAYGNSDSTSGNGGIAFGDQNITSCTDCIAFGASNTISTNTNGMTLCYGCSVTGLSALGLTRACTSSGSYGTAGGYFSTNSGAQGVVFGNNLTGSNFGGFVCGGYNEGTAGTSASSYNALNRAFQVGIGTSTTNRQNSITSLYNGNTGFLKTQPLATVDVGGGSAGSGTTPITPIHLDFVAPIATTATSTTGGLATITFATQPSAPFKVGSEVEVSGVTPTSYNGTGIVTGCTTTSVTFVSAGSGAQTVAGTVSIGQFNLTKLDGSIQRDSIYVYWTAGNNANLNIHRVAQSIDSTQGIQGNTVNSNASTGNVGENLSGSGQSSYTNYTTTATYQALDSITLTTGDWDLTCNFTFSANSATITTTGNAIFAVSSTTASASGTTEGLGDIVYIDENVSTSSKQSGIIHIRKSVASSTKYYLNSQSTFTLGNPQYVCSMRARRMR